MNYTPLGNGTAAGSNWTLTGLNLPTGQNIYIRARGYYRSGSKTARRASRNPCGMLLSGDIWPISYCSIALTPGQGDAHPVVVGFNIVRWLR